MGRAARTALFAAFALAHCSAPAPPTPWDPGRFPSVVHPADNEPTPARVELGRQLFHDPLLSSDREVACVTCHGQIWGLSDGLPVSVGVGGTGPAGTGRTGPNRTRRNAQTLWNVGLRRELFWDGRASSLEAQALVPLEAPEEMNRDPAALIEDLRAVPAYRALFVAAFPGESEPVTLLNLQRALAVFQRTLVSDRAPYDRYVAGDRGALYADDLRGMALFGEAGCAACHAPPLFESERYEPTLLDLAGRDDTGRAEVTRAPGDAHKYRVPTLRNVRESGPYFHDGSVATLAEAVHIEARGRHLARALSDDEERALVSFLSSGLTDTSRQPERPEYAPSGLMVPLDEYRVPR